MLNMDIVCPYCEEEQQYQGGCKQAKVFFAEGNHKMGCWLCKEVFYINTEMVYVYETKKRWVEDTSERE